MSPMDETMKKILGPTGRLLVGAVFICLLISQNAIASEQPSNLPDLQSLLKESISMRHVFGLQHHNSEFMPQSLPSKEKISLEGSHQVFDLKAFNAVKEREIVCNEVQNGDANAMDFTNSLDVSVTGPLGEQKKVWPEEKQEDDIEMIVDNALNASLESSENYGSIPGQRAGLPQLKPLGNYLDIDVSGISVSAVNTVEGGSAVATSNIIIKPVQTIICPSEVEEKLK